MPAQALVADYMTPLPYTVGAQQSAREALRRMRSQFIHHLPVLHGGELVGMVSERDAYFVVELTDDADAITVQDVMAPEPYCVAPTDPLAEAARGMASRRIGSAVVTRDRDVVGVLTSTDALYALVDQLSAGSSVPDAEGLVAHREAQTRLARHARLSQLVATSDQAAQGVLADGHDAAALAALRRRLPRLLRVLSMEASYTATAASISSEVDLLARQRDHLLEPDAVREVRASLGRLRAAL